MPSIFVLIADPDSICTGFHAKSKHGPVSELAATMTLTKQPKLFLYLETGSSCRPCCDYSRACRSGFDHECLLGFTVWACFHRGVTHLRLLVMKHCLPCTARQLCGHALCLCA